MTLGNGTTTSYGYDNQSALSSLAHNLAGTAQDNTWTYTYDADNRLRSASKTGFSATLMYDGMDRLRQTVLGGVTTNLLYDGADLVAEYDGSNAPLRRYVHGPGIDEPLVWYEGSGTGSKTWLYADHQGSIAATANSAGTSTATYSYGPYGELNATNGIRFRYTGQQWLEQIGLYYYKARFYSPTLGRFLQTDPVGYQSDLNLYAYVGNDPINRTDPSGNCPWCIAAAVGALAGGSIDLGAQLISNGGNLSQVDWDSVGISTVAGAGLSLLGPTGGLLGRGGTRAIEHGYAETAGLLNHGATRFGWTFNKTKEADVLSLRVGKKHFDIPGISSIPVAKPVRDGMSAGILGGGLASPSPSQASNGNAIAGGRPRK